MGSALLNSPASGRGHPLPGTAGRPPATSQGTAGGCAVQEERPRTSPTATITCPPAADDRRHAAPGGHESLGRGVTRAAPPPPGGQPTAPGREHQHGQRPSQPRRPRLFPRARGVRERGVRKRGVGELRTRDLRSERTDRRARTGRRGRTGANGQPAPSGLRPAPRMATHSEIGPDQPIRTPSSHLMHRADRLVLNLDAPHPPTGTPTTPQPHMLPGERHRRGDNLIHSRARMDIDGHPLTRPSTGGRNTHPGLRRRSPRSGERGHQHPEQDTSQSVPPKRRFAGQRSSTPLDRRQLAPAVKSASYAPDIGQSPPVTRSRTGSVRESPSRCGASSRSSGSASCPSRCRCTSS